MSKIQILAAPLVYTAFYVLCFYFSLSAGYTIPGDLLCDPDYGQPPYSDCLELTYTLYYGWPGTVGDKRNHYFALKSSIAPPWIPPYALSQRLSVPKFAHGG